MSRPRILLADDHTMVLEGLRRILEDEFDLVGLAEDGRALLDMAESLEPDVIVLDISMPKLNGLDAARHLHKLLPQTKLVFLTMHGDATYANEAFRAGASGYLLKRSAASELCQAIQAVLKNQCYMTPAITKDVLDACFQPLSNSPLHSGSLTPRQREVLQLIAEGKGTKEIATVLNITIKTVEFHKSHIMRELGLHNTAELTKYAISHGIVTPE